MTATTPVPRTSWLRLVAIQLVLIWRSRRWLEFAGSAAVLFGAMWIGAWLVDTARDGAWRMGAQRDVLSAVAFFWAVLVIVLVGAWPIILWRGESPPERRYHWSLPVPHGQHDLARVIAGAICVVAVAVAVTVVCALSAVTDAGSFSWFTAYTLGALTVYALCSIAAVTVAKPGHWILAVILTVFLVLFASRDIPGASRPLARVMAGRYGFMKAASGALQHVESPAPNPNRQGEAFDWPNSLGQANRASLLWLLPTIGVLFLTSVARRER